MLRPATDAKVQKGLQALLTAGRKDLTVEAVVLKRRFAPLFTKDELREARRRLATVARTPRRPRRRVPVDRDFPETLAPGRTYVEGAVRQVTINAYERDPRARAACLRRRGQRCTVCGLTFEKRYRPIDRNFIHVYHLRPVAPRAGSSKAATAESQGDQRQPRRQALPQWSRYAERQRKP
jgi:5-methylcytosine-specific restriction protein A